MMNFLDLSAASEDERRLIREMLVDTSVVNFAEPIRQQFQQQQLQPQQQQQLQNQRPSSQQREPQLQQQPQQQSGDQSQQRQNHNSVRANSPKTTHTTSTVVPTTSTVPPQTIADQVPPQMAGDMNSVIGIDMASSQPQSYAIPAPPNHVTAFAHPQHPPPHHVYSGPPIFQPIPHYLTFHAYNMTYPLPFLLPTTANSVVPPRQQNAPQSSPSQNASIPEGHHPRSHLHHSKISKLKEMPKHHQLHGHTQQLHSQQIQQDYRLNESADQQHLTRANDSTTRQTASYIVHDKLELHQKIQRTKEASDNSKSETESYLQDQRQSKEPQRNKCNNETQNSSNEIEIVKVSSDERLKTQSSLDATKPLNKLCQPLINDQRKSSEEDCNQEAERSRLKKNDADNEGKPHLNQDVKASTWGSTSSKSWASLFKAGEEARHITAVNGETDDNHTAIDTSNNEEATETNQNKYVKIESSLKITNNNASTREQRSQDAARRALDKLAPKLAQKINSISLKHSLPLLRPRGFINKGNGCYINSTLQALIACPPFYNLMKEIGDLRGLKRDNSCTPILDSFAELFQNFPPLDASKKNKQQSSPADQKLQMNYLQAEAIEPRCIYNVLGQIKSECLRGAQEDAEEFLSSILNGLHEEMIGLSESIQSSLNNTSDHNGHMSDVDEVNGDLSNDDNLWREVGPKNRSLPIRAATVINTPIQEIFGGSLFSIRTAGKDRCGHRSPFFDLQLDISSDNVKSLQDAIKSFTATEIIQDFYCSKTKQKLDAQRRTSLDQLPPILILHLKQFIYTQDHGLKKLMKRIEYPIDFELPETCLHDKNSDKNLKNSRSYKLLAVVYHEGKEAVKGHYLTDVYHIGSSQWIRCDDGNLKVVPAPRIENQDSTRTPYLLFYRRLNTLGPRQSNSHDSKKRS